ncbi:MAG TPA: hypothetical protein VNJ71_14065 [Gemmatimonadales bacterium]|nr:hypothetical protein [Gemmatimonadales bacterium]
MAEPAAPSPRGLRRHLPAALLAVAAVAALTHMAPFWATQRATPPGWVFTGNLTGSPDEMQYRILMERTQAVGPIVENRLTTEPNRPHIAMFFYYGIGRLARWLHAREAYVAAYVGMVLAAVLALGTFWIVDHFLASRYQTWWVYLALLFGGGLGAHLMLLDEVDALRGNTLFARIVSEGLRNAIVFEEYRSHYLFTTLFDTHFLFFLCTALLAIVALYRAVAHFTVPRLLAAGLAFGAATVLHIYDGVTLVFIAAGVVAVLRLRGLPVRHAAITLAVCAAAAGAAILWQMLLYRHSGLRIPDWRAQSIYASELALAYPLAWGLLAWGLGRYWRTAGLKECFLLGWILGCTVLTLSGPFYPYPDRGTLTLQIPLTIVAGAIYFSWRPRVAPSHALLAVALLAATPIWQVKRLLTNMSFSHHPSGAPPAYTWMSPDHQELVTALRRQATEHDVLIVDKSRVPWRTDDLWLTQGFPGRLYAGHYALTPDYARKREEVNTFFAEADPVKGAEFLRRAGVTIVFVRRDQEPARFERIPGLHRLAGNAVGTLFVYTP